MNLVFVIDEMDVLRRNMEQLKFPKGEEPDTVVKWAQNSTQRRTKKMKLLQN